MYLFMAGNKNAPKITPSLADERLSHISSTFPVIKGDPHELSHDYRSSCYVFRLCDNFNAADVEKMVRP